MLAADVDHAVLGMLFTVRRSFAFLEIEVKSYRGHVSNSCRGRRPCRPQRAASNTPPSLNIGRNVRRAGGRGLRSTPVADVDHAAVVMLPTVRRHPRALEIE